MKRTKRWLTCWLGLSAALALMLFGAVRADAATKITADLDPAEGDQGVTFAEVPPGAPLTIQIFAHGSENVSGFTVDAQFDPGTVDGTPMSIVFTPNPAFPVTFPVVVKKTVATGMGGQLPPKPVSEPMIMLGVFTFKTLATYERGGLKITKVDLKHSGSPSETIPTDITLQFARQGAGKPGEQGMGQGGGQGMGGQGQGGGMGQSGPSAEEMKKMYEKWKDSPEAKDLNGDGKIDEADFKIFMEKMMKGSGPGGPGMGGPGMGGPGMGGPGMGGPGGPGMGGPGMGGPGGPMGTPSAEEMKKMYEKWKDSPEAKDLNGDGKIDEADFKIFMEKMMKGSGPGGPGMGGPGMGGPGMGGPGMGGPGMGGPGMGGPGMGNPMMGGPGMGGPGMGGPGGPGMGGLGMGGTGGPGMGGPGGPGMGGPDPGMVFMMIQQMYPDPDHMPADLGPAFKKAEAAHKAAEAAHKEAMKAGLAFLKGYLDYLKTEIDKLNEAKDPKAQQSQNMAMQVEQAIHQIEMMLEMMDHPPMGPPMGSPPPSGTSGGNK